MISSALVTDASERVGLHVIRALGRQGVPIHAIAFADGAAPILGFISRYTTAHTSLPLQSNDEEHWLRDILAAGQEGDVLMTPCLNSLRRVLHHEPALRAKYRLLVPRPDALETVNDKWRLFEACERLGLRTPRTWRPTEAEVASLAARLRYPVVVKYRHDVNLYASAADRYRIVREPAECGAAWAEFHAVQERPIIQEYIAGEGLGFEALYDPNARYVTGFCHRRLLEYPISGGPSTVCESIQSPEMVAVGRRLLDSLGWQGVAMVEFKREAATGKLFVLEVNPRFWGSLPLSEAAGINFPHLLYQSACGAAPVDTGYRVGVRMRLLPTYLLSLRSLLAASPRAWGQGLSRLGYLLDPRVREGLFALDDLKPALAYVQSRMGAN